MDISELRTPALLCDKRSLGRNLKSMAMKAKQFNVSLRPHIKTHKCVELAKLQEKQGIHGITVSTLKEAEVFSKNGFSDITYAVPLDQSKITQFLELTRDISLKAVIDDQSILERFNSQAKDEKQDVDVLVQVDMGYHRCGVTPTDSSAIKVVECVEKSSNLSFRGILTHAGNSYSCLTTQCIKDIAEQEQKVMVDFAKNLSNHSLDLYPEVISIGSTPTISLCDIIKPEISEIRPGNYAYYDYTQVKLGSCNISDCALTVLSRIVGKYEGRVVLDAGATALSKDQGPTHIEPDCGYGKIFEDYRKSKLDTNSRIENLSQEHGKVSFTNKSIVKTLDIGDLVRILPNHSCLTNNLFRYVYVTDGDMVIDKWEIHSGH